MGRREEVLDSAIDVVAGGGMRALTHRAVDRQASLPIGATSNVFRTRDELVAGMLERITEREIATSRRLKVPRGSTLDIEAMSTAVTSLIEDLCRRHRNLELARLAVAADATVNVKLAVVVTRTGKAVMDWVAEGLASAGSARPNDDARVLLSLIDGLISNRLAGVLQRRHVKRAVDATLAGLLTR